MAGAVCYSHSGTRSTRGLVGPVPQEVGRCTGRPIHQCTATGLDLIRRGLALLLELPQPGDGVPRPAADAVSYRFRQLRTASAHVQGVARRVTSSNNTNPHRSDSWPALHIPHEPPHTIGMA